MVAIKICGINGLAAMDAALSAGADFVGLVFFPPSPRNVSLEAGAKLAARARGRARIVALTVDADDALLSGIVEKVAPDMVQFHGKEPPARIAHLRARFGRPAIKAIPVERDGDVNAASAYAEVADWLLFDARAPSDATRPGGHGRAFDWSLLAGVARIRPIMLSGGLSADNVADAIHAVRPDAVDVSSGVESAPGVKDPEKIRHFVEIARAAAAKLKSPENVS